MQNVSKTPSFLEKNATHADLDGSAMRRDAKRDAPRPTKTPNCHTCVEIIKSHFSLGIRREQFEKGKNDTLSSFEIVLEKGLKSTIMGIVQVISTIHLF